MTNATRTRHNRLDPYLLYGFFVAVGLGTFPLEQPLRLAILYTVLALLSLVYATNRSARNELGMPQILRGGFLGLVVGIPIAAVLMVQLDTYVRELYPEASIALIFYQACLVPAIVEEAFFRGVVLPEKGLWIAAMLNGLAALIYFLPHSALWASLVAAGVALLLGIIYGQIRMLYGVTGAMACHLVLAFLVMLIPLVVASFRVA